MLHKLKLLKIKFFFMCISLNKLCEKDGNEFLSISKNNQDTYVVNSKIFSEILITYCLCTIFEMRLVYTSTYHLYCKQTVSFYHYHNHNQAATKNHLHVSVNLQRSILRMNALKFTIIEINEYFVFGIPQQIFTPVQKICLHKRLIENQR